MLILIGIVILVVLVILFFGISEQKNEITRTIGLENSELEYSAHELLIIIKNLQEKNSEWTEIFSAINGDENKKIHEQLIMIRGPHLFSPKIGLNVLETGCIIAMKKNNNAMRSDAIEEALRDSDLIVKAGD